MRLSFTWLHGQKYYCPAFLEDRDKCRPPPRFSHVPVAPHRRIQKGLAVIDFLTHNAILQVRGTREAEKRP